MLLSLPLRFLLLHWTVPTARSANAKDCRHGTYMPDTQSCQCDEHWGTAGITDTVDFLEGVCEQYHCIDSKTCQEILGIPGATCPVQNWNCYCGWAYAFSNGWRGYETPLSTHGTNATNTGAECMGIMYTLSVWSAMTLYGTMEAVAVISVALACLCLCVGKKRIRCDHHDPSLVNEIRRVCGSPPDCPGGCSAQPVYGWDSLQDDCAWSIYVLSVSVWIVVFLLIAYGMALFIWSIVLWAAVLLLLILAALAGLGMLCGALCGEGASCDCHCGACECGSCDCCGCDPTVGLFQEHTLSDAMYWGGPHPVNGWYCDCSGFSTGTPSDSSCCDCRGFCYPIAWLILRFPRMPENMWGGVLGRCMGTHAQTPPEETYQGGHALIDFLQMRWARAMDLHNDTGWRNQVHDFLYTHVEDLPYHDVLVEDGEHHFYLGRASGTHKQDIFTSEDGCVASSYEDYQNNLCWICQSSNSEWDMWLTCRHMFCRRCSEEMLRRRMPCPLCRVYSSRILRGNAL